MIFPSLQCSAMSCQSCLSLLAVWQDCRRLIDHQERSRRDIASLGHCSGFGTGRWGEPPLGTGTPSMWSRQTVTAQSPCSKLKAAQTSLFLSSSSKWERQSSLKGLCGDGENVDSLLYAGSTLMIWAPFEPSNICYSSPAVPKGTHMTSNCPPNVFLPASDFCPCCAPELAFLPWGRVHSLPYLLS